MKKSTINTIICAGHRTIKRKATYGFILVALVLSSCGDELLDSQSADGILEQKQSFTLVENEGELISLERDIGEFEKSTARTTDAAGNDRGRFNIELKFLLPPTDDQVAVFEEAAARWERIIIKDVPSVAGPIPSGFTGLPPVVADGDVVDDVIIEVVLQPIDGPGMILGGAGPAFVRTSDFLTISGVMIFDVDDLDFLDQIGLFEEVIVHEMGHVLGVGTLWNVNRPDLGIVRNLLQGSFEEPYFSGHKANVFWNAEGGVDKLPIENIGGPGTRFGHWRESVLGNELMTGFLNLGENPLSRITAGSMEDLGYGAASVGEQYDLPKGTPGVNPEASTSDAESGLDIASREILVEPIGKITASNK